MIYFAAHLNFVYMQYIIKCLNLLKIKKHYEYSMIEDLEHDFIK